MPSSMGAERYRKLLESCPLPVFVFDKQRLMLTEANDAALAAYDVDRAALLTTSLFELGFPRALAEMAAGAGAIRRRARDGSEAEVDVRCRDLDAGDAGERLVIAVGSVGAAGVTSSTIAELGLRAILDNTPIILALLDAQGRFEFVGGSILAESGLDPKQLIGCSAVDLFAATPMFDEQGRPTTTEAIFERVRRGEPAAALTRLGARYIETRYQTVRAGDGEPQRIVSVSLDVTSSRSAEEALRTGEARLRALAENSSDAVKTADERGVITYTSSSTARVLGYGDGELVGRSIFDLVHPDDRAALERAFAECLAKPGVPLTHECRYRHRDGSYVDLQAVRVNRLEDPNLRAIITNYRSISAEKQLRAEQERFFALSHDLLAIASMDGYFRRVNPSFERVLGYSREEILSRPFLDFIHPDDVESTVAEMSKLAAGATTLSFRNRYRTRAGDYRWLSWASVPDVGRGVAYAVARDVTDVMLLEQQLAQSQKMEAIGRLAGGIAHDFNNMLSVIIGVAETALSDLRADDPMRADFEDIAAAGNRSAALTRQLLAFSRRQLLQPRVTNLNALIRDTERVLARMVGEDIELTLCLRDDIADVKIDPGQFDQVLMNLVVNARDAMPDGGRLTIETANVTFDEEYVHAHVNARAGAHVMLAVSDSGVGMDAETRARIFEPFFTTKPEGRGTGLGLATVFGIVNQSGGHIFVYSEPGRGTTFKVYVPATRESRTAAAPLAATGDVGGGERILLVEDEALVRVFVKRVLERAGYEVLEAASAAEALQLAARTGDRPIDLLLTDVVMPQMSGPALAEKLCATEPKLRVLYMSGYAERAIVQHGFVHEGIDYVQKPVTASALLSRLREILQRPPIA